MNSLGSLITSVNANLKDRLSNPLLQDYVQRLQQMSILQIKREPAESNKQLELLKQKNVDVLYAFPSVLEADKEIEQLNEAVLSVADRMKVIAESVPTIANSTAEFSTRMIPLLKERDQTMLLVLNGNKIDQFMSIPLFLDSLMANSMYNEALDLYKFMSHAKIRYSFQVVQKVYNELNDRILNLQSTLIEDLQNDVSLADCLNAVAILQRIGRIDDRELLFVFLKARRCFMMRSLENIRYENPASYLKLYLQVAGDSLLTIINQYNSLFECKDKVDMILADFLTNIVIQIESCVDAYVNKIDDLVILSTVFINIKDFGAKLGEIGLDNSGLLCSLLDDALLKIVKDIFARGTKQFNLLVRNAEEIWNGDMIISANDSEENTTPLVLMKSPALAMLTNLYLQTLNELMAFSLEHSTCQAVSRVFVHNLEIVGDSLLLLVKSCVGDSIAGAVYSECALAADIFFPFIFTCVDNVTQSDSHLIADAISKKLKSALPTDNGIIQ